LVQFTFDDTFSPGVDVTGDGDLLTEASGLVMISVTPLPGAQSPQCNHTSCPDSVHLELESAVITATGTWGSEPITLHQAFGVGGVPRARMASLLVPTVTTDSSGHTYPFCSSATGRATADLVVVLDGISPDGGTRVDLTFPKGIGLDLPNNVTVPQGNATFDIAFSVPQSFNGSLQFTAAAGGAITSYTFPVNPPAACTTPPSRPQYEAYVPPWLVGCTACSVFGDLNDETWQVSQVGSQFMVIRGSTVTPLAKAFPQASAVGADAINDSGMIAGRMTVGGVAQAYRANLAYGIGAAQLIGEMTPMDLGAAGTVVGYRVDAGGLYHSVYDIGRGVTDLALSSSYGVAQSRALRIADSGQIVGTYTDKAGTVRGYRWVNGTTYTLPTIGATPGLPVAINKLDAMAVVGSRGGAPVSAIIDASGTATLLGVPSGYSSFEITSLNRWGYAVGTATAVGIAPVTVGFAWIPGRGFVSLSGYVKGLAVDHALRITDANQVVVHGTAGGVTDLYLLTL
ncbi:MAG TPA: hypothetical protein VLX92_32665, partial [Kofleriaceae bacterium]|nr:hypothetical protein [Kofleriaceae bacterium]